MSIETIGSEEQPISWQEFENEVESNISSIKQKIKNNDIGYYSHWIYRGQSNFKWSLQTSLERYCNDIWGGQTLSFDFKGYYRFLGSAVPAINSLSERAFPRFVAHELEHDLGASLPYLELLYYARHHGFPTPILDWSKSHYVAAYFAFSGASEDTPVAIYGFNDHMGLVRSRRVQDPMIWSLGDYVETHPRHYKQQSVYTYCSAKDSDGAALFMPHEKAVEANPDEHHLKKYIISGESKKEIIEKLFRMNINKYTLFGSEESLLEYLAYKELELNANKYESLRLQGQ